MQRWAGRWPAVVVVSALTLGIVMLMARPVVGQESGHGHVPAGAEGILPPGDWTQQQIDDAVEKVRETERVLPAKFGDFTKLPELGYGDFGISAPGGYDHWGRRDYNTDDHILDPEFPESLVFQRMPDGSRRLVAAMFFAPAGSTMSTIPPDIAWLPGWHSHDGQFCVNEQGRFVAFQSNGTCSIGTPSILPPMTHVWIVDNHCGHRFAGIDSPGVVCYGHDEHQGPPGTTIGTRPGPAPTTTPGRPGATTTTTTRSGGSPSTAPPATPVKAEPTYTG